MIYNNRFKAWFLKQRLVKPTYKEERRVWFMRKRVREDFTSIAVCKNIDKDKFDVRKLKYKGDNWNWDYLTAISYLVNGESYRSHYLIKKNE